MSALIVVFLQNLPEAGWDMGASLVRMVLAYLLSLAFAITYGYFAATSRVAERILLPILDILQSVPIMGFFPVAIVFFVSLTGPQSIVGPNFAAVFLIFTSMSWNMAFGVYESVKSLPGDLKEVSDSMGVRGWQRARRLFLPSTANRLVYNSVLSWTAGWYYLVTSEIFSTYTTTIALPGIGTYLLRAAAGGNPGTILAGVFVLVLVIMLLNFLLWRPLSKWAEKYRYDVSPSGEAGELPGAAADRRASRIVGRAFVRGASVVRRPLTRLGERTLGALARQPSPTPELVPSKKSHMIARNSLHYLALGIILVVGWLLLIVLGVGVYSTYTSPISPTALHYIRLIPLALAFSAGRVFLAYLVSLAIAFPLALWIFRSRRGTRFGMPVIQVIASIPATALFPLFLFSLKDVIGTESAVIFVVVTGMIWYLFFNLYSGLRTIPPDLEEAARSMGLKGRPYYRKLVLPGTFAAFVTGSITALGGGWNTLVIAEYLSYGNQHISVLGLGELIDLGVFAPPTGIAGGFPLMVTALLTLTLTVVVVNKLIWRPLYRIATEKYRYD